MSLPPLPDVAPFVAISTELSASMRGMTSKLRAVMTHLCASGSPPKDILDLAAYAEPLHQALRRDRDALIAIVADLDELFPK